MPRIAQLAAAVAAALTLAGAGHAQPTGITMDMIMRQLPLEGAPAAGPGPYEPTSGIAAGAPGLTVFRPADLSAFPTSDTLPVLAWGNGGCNRDPAQFVPYLEGVATHGYLVVTTAAQEDAGRATAEDLTAAIDRAYAENAREDSPLEGKIDTDHVAVMGVSCGGMMTLGAAGDPRGGTIGVFNSGAGMGAPGDGSVEETLGAIHTPTLYLNGGEVDFASAASLANYEAINHVPVFYGARDNGGHSATYSHPGGGEFANVTADWLDWRFKDDADAGETFSGEDCGLCADPNWSVGAKGWE